MWFGTQHHSEWINAPLRGAEMTPESWGTEGTYLSGGGFVRQSQDSHRQYIFEWSGASSRASAETMQAYRDGVYNKTPADLLYFIDPLMYNRNILPKRWAQPGILTTPGEAEYSPIGVVTPVDTPVSMLGNQRVPLVGAQVSSPITSLGGLNAITSPGVGSVWVPIPEGETLTVIAWTGNPVTTDSGLYLKAQSTGGSWRSPEHVGPHGVTVSGAKGILLATVGTFDFYGARAVVGQGDEWNDSAVYEWTGEPNKSTSTRTTSNGSDKNLPDFSDVNQSSEIVSERRNLLIVPAPNYKTSPNAWFAHRGGTTSSVSGGYKKGYPEGLDGIKTAEMGNVNVIGDSDTRLEIGSGSSPEFQASVSPGTTYYASIYALKNWEDRMDEPVRALIRWFDSSGEEISDSEGSTSVLNYGEWTLLEASGVAPSGAVTAAVVASYNAPVGLFSLSSDSCGTAAILQTSPDPYFDGTYSLQGGDTQWNGTPNMSTSREVIYSGSNGSEGGSSGGDHRHVDTNLFTNPDMVEVAGDREESFQWKNLVANPRGRKLASLPPAIIEAPYAVSLTASGEEEYAKGADIPAYTASLIKVLNAYVARQTITDERLDETVIVLPEDVQDGSTANLQEGDEVSYRDLFHGMLIPSGNDAAWTIAHNVGLELDPATSNPINSFVQKN